MHAHTDRIVGSHPAVRSKGQREAKLTCLGCRLGISWSRTLDWLAVDLGICSIMLSTDVKPEDACPKIGIYAKRQM